ncbi:N-acetylated-alpha-linked acidic dipeptidase 2-like [Mercenaria mercenaria]|uniref:N-acetylated-alpha-linked acidic dipeptidase 2-like n=1 Tax=Mercenaria mercenaria TaxID=6596 RepID=UPI00234F0A80|nr:N-acetylated-alpha-linked acidic dipeptidase 2-like [Mercenaria mercenaria]
MGSSTFRLDGGDDDNKRSTHSYRNIIVAVFLLCLSFAIGLLVGHFGIEKDSSEEGTENDSGVFLPGVPEAIVREANPSVSDWILQELNPSNIRENLRKLVTSPHVAGTERDFEQADDIRKFWLDAGLDVAVTTPYDILLSYPDDVEPNLVSVINSSYDTVLQSPFNEANLTNEERPWEFPFPYLGYSGNGTVRGQIVYVNYGRLEDFEYLQASGIHVSGCIVLARYGRGGRSGKVKRAEDFGAIGMILYSDPADYIAPWVTDDYYPDSVWIPPTATSRGSIFRGTGDPLTPGYPAIASAYRYDESDEESELPKIPAMPVGFEFAEQLLGMISGPDAPPDWTGRLLNQTTYKTGPGFTDSSLVLELNVNTRNERRVAYNAFGMIRGEVEPDRYVMLGNHRDSWVLGAVDPSSGTATMMELSRVLGQLVKEGRWRPRRSIIFCSWGAEEFGLIGSTEWIEENSNVLDFRSVAYINMDIAVTGNYSIRGRGSPPVFTAMYRAAQKVPNPNTTDIENPTVYDAWYSRKPLTNPQDGSKLNIPQIVSPGGGSDYGTFQMRAGITCADFRYDQDYSGENILFYPLYHTSYETFYAVDELIDPGFVLHTTIGKMSGELLRDLADSKIIPFNMSDYGLFLDHYTYALEKNATKEIIDYKLNITELHMVIDLYKEEASNFHKMVDGINTNNPVDVRTINDQMIQIERTFLDPASLPGRSQIYRHLIHSTPQYSAFPEASFPGIEDAIFKLRREGNNQPDLIRELQHHFSVLVFTIQSAAYSLKDSTAFFRSTM